MVKNFKRGRRATLNLARHLAVQGPARREAEKSADNLALINLQLRRLPVQVRAKREADEREGRTSMVDLAASQRVERKLRLSAFRDNRSVERKRERGLQRRGHNYLVNFRGGSRAKVPEPLLWISKFPVAAAVSAAISVTFAGDTPAHYSNSAICTAFKAAPFSN